MEEETDEIGMNSRFLFMSIIQTFILNFSTYNSDYSQIKDHIDLILENTEYDTCIYKLCSFKNGSF